jgi:hypothetical protein
LLTRRDLLQIMIITWLHMRLSFMHTGLGLMRMIGLVRFLWLVWRIVFLLILWSLSGLIRCELFFTTAMNSQDSLLFLLLFVRSSFFAMVMILLILSSIGSLLFDFRLTLLVLSCLLTLVSHARIRRLLLSFITCMTS